MNETVRLPGGKVADPADLSWQLRNTHGASKESLLVVALIKARSRQGESERTGRLFDC